MGRFFKSMRIHWLMVAILCSGCFVSASRSFDGFDNPFPQTPFKRAWGIATQAFHMFSTLAKASAQDPDLELLTDACLGKLVQLDDALHQLVSADEEISGQDFQSLKKVIKQFDEKSRKVDKPADISRLMETFTKKIVALAKKL